MFSLSLPPPVLAETAAVNVSTKIYTEGGKTYSVTTKTVNGQTTTETKAYDSGQPVVSSVSAYAGGSNTNKNPAPPVSVTPSPFPTPEVLGQTTASPAEFRLFLKSLFLKLLSLLRL